MIYSSIKYHFITAAILSNFLGKFFDFGKILVLLSFLILASFLVSAILAKCANVLCSHLFWDIPNPLSLRKKQ